MKNVSIILVLMMLAVSKAMAGNLINVAGDSNVALGGYDPVAFFADSMPVHGDPSLSVEHEGATYFFSSKRNRKRFAADPVKYAPQFGGYCAYGVSVGALFPVDVDTWQVIDGRLYLNLNPGILELFNEDPKGNLEKAAQQWMKLAHAGASEGEACGAACAQEHAAHCSLM